MKPAILLIGVILCLIAGYSLFSMGNSYYNTNDCVQEHGCEHCSDSAESTGINMILGLPLFIICGMVGLVLVGDGMI